MSNVWASVNRILPFSCVDGPGNRLVIFFQGCNFRCKNCHNPYTIGHCNDCGVCVATCPHDALFIEHHRVTWRPEQCQHCDTCLDRCDDSSTPMAINYTPQQLLAEVERYRPFLTGITVSGGEATLHHKAIFLFFQLVKSSPHLRHLTCFIDSNGYTRQSVWQTLLPVMDGAMIDLKAWGNECHQFLTGRSNQRVLQTLRYLARSQKLYEIRLLVIPDHTDYMEHMDEMATFFHSLSPNLRIRLNAFQTHGLRHEARTWRKATQDDIEQLALSLNQKGFQNIIKPSVYLP